VCRGELCGLQICDTDLDRGLVHVAFNYVVRADQRVRKDTKTHQVRWLAIDPDTCVLIAVYLREIRAELAAVPLIADHEGGADPARVRAFDQAASQLRLAGEHDLPRDAGQLMAFPISSGGLRQAQHPADQRTPAASRTGHGDRHLAQRHAAHGAAVLAGRADSAGRGFLTGCLIHDQHRIAVYYNQSSQTSAGIMGYRRSDGNDIALIFLNFSDTPQTMTIPFPSTDTFREQIDAADRPAPMDLNGATGDPMTVTVPSNYGYVFTPHRDVERMPAVSALQLDPGGQGHQAAVAEGGTVPVARASGRQGNKASRPACQGRTAPVGLDQPTHQFRGLHPEFLPEQPLAEIKLPTCL
jgi:hypothetical protein